MAGTPTGNRSEGAATDLGRAATATALAAVLGALALAWRDLLELPLVGEDYAVLTRVRDGEPANLHVFRPLADAFVAGVYAIFRADSGVPYHVGSILVHALGTVLTFALGARLFGRRVPALVAALAFAVGAVACDTLAWSANITRPLSCIGMLVAANGLVRWGRGERLGAVLTGAGLAWQALANEEFYGTALLACAWLLIAGLRGRRSAWLGLVAVAAGAIACFLLLHRVPDSAEGALGGGLAAVPSHALERAGDVMRGLGVALPAVGALPLVLLAWLAFAGRREEAAFLALAWLCAFVPFVLDAPVEYRSYASLAPTALVIGGAVCALAGLSAEEGRSRSLEGFAGGALVFLVLLGAVGPRSERIERWHRVTREIDAVDALIRERAWSPPEAVPALVNLDTSTAAVVLFRLGLDDVSELTALGFLDAAGGFVEPEESPPGPWIGRRLDGSYGEIDPLSYFAGRALLPELRLVGELREATDRDEARALLADPELNAAVAAVAETDVAALGERSAEGTIAVMEPFDADPVAVTARQVLAIDAPQATVLAVCPAWQYSHLMRFALDQMIYSDVSRTRVLRLVAIIDGAQPIDAFFVDLYGFGVPIPAGKHLVELRWRRATPEESR